MIYLAFDFGDGTTCSSCFDDSLSDREPTVPNIIKGRDEIWTNIAFDVNGENPVIGLTGAKRGYPNLLSNWKSKPSKPDNEGWKRKAAIDFMRECFKLFLSNNPEYSDGQNWTGTCNGQPCRVVIGVPCDWSDEDITEYKKMADEAGLPDVLVFKESQAAVLYARRFMAKGLPDEYLKKGVLMVDIGSSTTDFTYMKGLRAAHSGLTLGAKYVEQAFLGDAMSRAGYEYFKETSDAESKDHGRKLRALNLMSVRQWKEDFFSAAQQANPDVQTSPLPGSGLKVGEEDYGATYITTEFVERCLNDKSNGVTFSLPHLSSMWLKYGMDAEDTWRGHFRHALHCVEEHWGINAPELTIFVTGGASRMNFVEADVKTVFGENVHCFFGNDRERSFSVVKGLAWTAHATALIDVERGQYKQKIKTFMSAGHTGDSKVSEMISSIAEEVAEELVTKLASEMRWNPETVNTKRKIEAFARGNAADLLKGIPIEEKIIASVKELLATEEMLKLFSSLQENLGRADISANMPDFKIGHIKLPSGFRVNLDLDAVVNGIVLTIVIAILWALSFVTLGWSLLLIAAIKLGGDAFLKKGPDDDIGVDKIKKAANDVREKKPEIVQQIRSALTDSHNGVSYRNQVREKLTKILTHVKLQELNALEGLFNYEEQ